MVESVKRGLKTVARGFISGLDVLVVVSMVAPVWVLPGLDVRERSCVEPLKVEDALPCFVWLFDNVALGALSMKK